MSNPSQSIMVCLFVLTADDRWAGPSSLPADPCAITKHDEALVTLVLDDLAQGELWLVPWEDDGLGRQSWEPALGAIWMWRFVLLIFIINVSAGEQLTVRLLPAYGSYGSTYGRDQEKNIKRFTFSCFSSVSIFWLPCRETSVITRARVVRTNIVSVLSTVSSSYSNDGHYNNTRQALLL